LHKHYLDLNVLIRDGKEPKPSKNEPNQNSGFARLNSVLSLNETVGTFTHFAINAHFT